MPKYNLRVNGSVRTVDSSDPDQPLLYVLRGLGLTATKFGCGLGQCGLFGAGEGNRTHDIQLGKLRLACHIRVAKR
jgi:xanthine dehydrogenase iron-sulfur cluster and FAD-binding subunit A